jgi:hypothetical protein
VVWNITLLKMSQICRRIRRGKKRRAMFVHRIVHSEGARSPNYCVQLVRRVVVSVTKTT